MNDSDIMAVIEDRCMHVLKSIGICYFFTITLRPKIFKYSSITQLELTLADIAKKLYRYTSHFVIVAELTKQGNVHYHAICSFSEAYRKNLMVDAFKKDKICGFIHTDGNVIEDMKRVADYITKDVYNTIRVIRQHRGYIPRFYTSSQEFTEMFASLDD